jgi:signal transduction histidine kinase
MNNKNYIKYLLQYFLESLAAIFKITFTLLPKGLAHVFKHINKRLRFSITFKTTVIYSLIFSSILFILSTILVGLFSFYTFNTLTNNFDKISALVEPSLINDSSANDDIIKKISEKENITVGIFNSNKKLSYTTKENYTEPLLDSIDTPSIKYLPDGFHIYIAKKISLDNKNYYIQFNKLLIEEVKYFIILIAVLSIYSIIALIIAIRIGSKTIKKMLIPIANMTFTAKSISAKDLGRRLDVVDSHDELKDLAETFNDMLSRIESTYEQQNRFVSDASHELRTPISVVQGYANLLSRWGKEDKAVLDESVNAIKNEAENMKNLVEKLLFLARADKNTQKLEKEEFYINELIDEVLKDTTLIAHNHTIINTQNDKALFFADKNLIKQCLRIFIDNSIKYTPVGGNLTINSFLKQNILNITIEDNGIGISKEDLPYIFDRFYRCDKARSRQSGGTGLGLSIAKWIIGSHNGTIEVQSALNRGTKIIINLPI